MNEVISDRQLMLLVFTLTVTDATLFVPTYVVQNAGQDGWLSVLIGGLAGALVVFVVSFLGLRYPKMTLIEYSEIILGKWLSKILGLFYFLFYLHITITIFYEISTIIKEIFLPKSSLPSITIIIFIVSAYSVKMGLETITRANILNLFVTFIAMFIILFLLLKDMNIELLTPVLSKGIVPVLKDSIAPVGWFGEGVSIAFLIPFINKPKKAGMYSIIGVIWASVTLAFMAALSIMIFGINLTSLLKHPTLEAVRYINVNDYIQNIEILFLIPWIIANYILICLFYYITVLIISKWLKIKKTKTLVLPIGLVISSMSLVIFKNDLQLSEFLSHAWGFYSLPFEYGIPIILFIIELIRNKGTKKMRKLKI